jgi:nitrate/TMAO reductase-like tetraheme cytochrome c subunit
MSDGTKKPSLARNAISAVGLVIAAISLANIIFLVVADATGVHNPYVGILAYAVVPAFLVAGLALFVLGMLLERRRRRRVAPDHVPEYPSIDLNSPHTRRVFVISTIGIFVFIIMSLIGSYQAYQFTDSDQFCGLACHTVMNPEYTAYKQSPHARVGCVGCHVGNGAGWYLRSKLSGSYQLYSVLFKKYPRPIASPVHSLRPARETCEQCHWPEKFFGAQLKVFTHFQYDETNTPRETRMLIKTGGGSPAQGLVAGIHWHMFNESEIQYVASDPQRQKIEWVRLKNRRTGAVEEFWAQDSKLKPQQIAATAPRTMDCVDCHNRPTHIYVPPDRSVDRALLAGRIDRTIPYIKQQAVEALTKDYNTTPEAMIGIEKSIRAYYQKSYAAVYASKRAAIDQSIATSKDIFSKTRFPEMKVDWRTHPDNIGHFYSLGCFRCHDNQHKSKSGKVIAKDCHICHDVLSEAVSGSPMFSMPKNEFQHPVDLGDMTAVTCADCHTGKPMS